MAKNDDWKKELNRLTDETGISLRDVCEYLGIEYRSNIGFYYKVPKKRETLIGIGMAFKQDLDTINGWIVRFGEKKKLYSKEALSDLIWIYLINSNHRDTERGINYYSLYDECREKVRDTYIEVWNEYVSNSEGTVDVDRKLGEVGFDEGFEALRSFVTENMDSFKTAYARPRKMLAGYVDVILDAYSKANDGAAAPVNLLRGYLDDSMINYITGSPESINVMDMSSRSRVINSKAVPKLKRTHIAMCLALGMCESEINEYLGMMGYSPLDRNSGAEGRLIVLLEKWEKDHPEVSSFKERRFGAFAGEPDARKDLQAVSEMLMLRQDLKYEAAKTGEDFPYIKD